MPCGFPHAGWHISAHSTTLAQSTTGSRSTSWGTRWRISSRARPASSVASWSPSCSSARGRSTRCAAPVRWTSSTTSRRGSAPTTSASSPVIGELAKERLGVDADEVERLDGQIEHFFHLAAIYDLTADADSQRIANVEGTRHALQLAEAVHAEHFHQASSIAAAGLYKGVVHRGHVRRGRGRRPQPVLRHQARVRARRARESRRCRGASTGRASSSATRRPARSTRSTARTTSSRPSSGCAALTPSWLRGVGIEGGEINLVPVDYVAKAMDYLAHQPDLDGRDVPPDRSRAAHRRRAVQGADEGGARRPSPTLNVDARALDALPSAVRRRAVARLPGAKQVTDLVLAELGIPRESFAYLTYPTHFDSTKTQAALAGSGIEVPPFATLRADALGVLGAHVQPRPPQGQARWPGPSRARR